MSKAVRVFLALAAACLLPAAVGCSSGSTSSAVAASPSTGPARDLLYMTHLVLQPRRPAHVTFQVATGSLQVTVSVNAPLNSWALEQVTPLSGGSHPLPGGNVALREQAHAELGLHTYVLRTMRPLTAGWYRLELVGRGEVVQLWVGGH
jgi:hypothetical protein